MIEIKKRTIPDEKRQDEIDYSRGSEHNEYLDKVGIMRRSKRSRGEREKVKSRILIKLNV